MTGVAFVLAAPPLLRLAPVHWQSRLTVAMVALFGIVQLLHGTFTYDCAVFTDGDPVGEHDTLRKAAADVGLDPQEVDDVLAGAW